MEDASFPRGGEAPSPAAAIKRPQKMDDDLFKVKRAKKGVKFAKQSVARAQEKKAKAKKRTKESSALGAKLIQNLMHTAGTLAPSLLTSGVNVLGVVSAVQDYKILVSLPNAIKGVVCITDVSAGYTELLKELAEGRCDQQQVSPLSHLVQPGQVVRCQVLESSKTQIKLTLEPRRVNQLLAATSLAGGMTVQAAVASCEDHGYVLDLGVKGLTAFVRTADAGSYVCDVRDGVALCVGACVTCALELGNRIDLLTGESRAVKVALEPRLVYRTPLAATASVTLASLLPGMNVAAKVSKVTPDGLLVKFLAYTGSVHASHLPQPLSDYSQGDELRATVLYINPTTKGVSLSALTHLVTPDLAPRQPFAGLQHGSVVVGAAVERVDPQRGVYLSLPPRGVRGLAHRHQLADTPLRDLAVMFPSGSLHDCRVLGFDLADQTALVSLRPSIVKQQVLHYADIEPAQRLTALVESVSVKGMKVQLENTSLHGWVPDLHLADVMLKHPEKKYAPGDKIKVKALEVQPSEKRLKLTCKKSLLRSKFPDLTSYEQAAPGAVHEGVVVKLMKTGVLVAFYAAVTGFAPRHELSTERVDFPDRVFFTGQVVRCRVLSVMPEERRMTLSLKDVGKAAAGASRAELPPDFRIGSLVRCRVVRGAELGVEVTLLDASLPAFIPRAHLSDHHTLRAGLLASYREGDELEAMYLSSGQTLVLTLKPSLLSRARQSTLITDFADIVPGALLPGTVTKRMEYGVFVDLTHGIVGLAPNKFLFDRKVPDPGSLYELGQSIEAKVVELDADKRRLLLSLRMSDCYQDDDDSSASLNLLEAALAEHKRVVTRLSDDVALAPLTSLAVGAVVKVTVSLVNDDGALCDVVDSGVRGFARSVHVPPGTEAGAMRDAVVLFVDPMDRCVELSLAEKLVLAVAGRLDNKFSKVTAGETLRSEVLLVRDEWVLVSLSNHGKGQVAFVPARRHLNDVLERRQFVIGQENKIRIARVSDSGCVLATLTMHARGAAEKEIRQKVKLGSVATATITKVAREYLYATLDAKLKQALHARVHITELSETVREGENPLDQFAVGQKVTLKVIGKQHRCEGEGKSGRALARVNQRDATRDAELGHLKMFLEGTLLAGKLARSSYSDLDNPAKRRLRPGLSVPVYVSHYAPPCLYAHVTAKLRAKVFLANLSLDAAVLRDAASHFKTGAGYQAYVLGEPGSGGVYDVTFTTPTRAPVPGDLAPAIVTAVMPDGLRVTLSAGRVGRVGLAELGPPEWAHSPTSRYTKHDVVSCHVLAVRDDSRLDLGLADHPNPLTWDGLAAGQIVPAYVTASSPHSVWLTISHDVAAPVKFERLSKHFVSDVTAVFFVGKAVQVAVVSVDGGSRRLDLSLLEQYTGRPEDIAPELVLCSRAAEKTDGKEKKDKAKDATPQKKRRKRKKTVSESEVSSTQAGGAEETAGETKRRRTRSDADTDTAVTLPAAMVGEEDSTEDTASKAVEQSVTESKVIEDSKDMVVVEKVKIAPRLSVSAGFSWDGTLTLPPLTSNTAGDDHSDDSEVEEVTEAQPAGRSRPKSRSEKVAARVAEEQRVFAREQELLDPERALQTTEDYDRLVLASPDSSLVWLRYIAHHLETAEVEKARAVAERALKTINFREEQEKLNVWVAYLNLENLYGTPDSLKAVFDRSVVGCEPLLVYQQLVAIFEKSEQHEEAEKLHEQMTRRFNRDKSVFCGFGLFLFRRGRYDVARRLLQRALKTLDAKHHMEVLSKFAQLEFKHGDAERGKTMFETMTGSYPRRNDLWQVYTDMVTSRGDMTSARLLYERQASLDLGARKMKTVFKRYLDFETKHGNDDTVAHVKGLALAYVTARSQTYVKGLALTYDVTAHGGGCT